MNDMEFSMELAGITFRVVYRYPDTKAYCGEYLLDSEQPCRYTLRIDEQALESERARLKTQGKASRMPPAEALENLNLCRQVAEILPAENTLLFHCSALALDGQGVLFAAPSGTGKSTHARLWRQVFGSRVTTVNDDKPLVRIAGGRAQVYGSPWQGKHQLGQNTSAPVKAICFLSQSPENSLRAVSQREAFPLLLQQVYIPECPDSARKTLALVEQLSGSVKLYHLSCNLEPQAAVTACRGIFQEEE